MADNLLPLDVEQVLVDELPKLLERLEQGRLRIAPIEVARRFSREQGAAELAGILDSVAG